MLVSDGGDADANRRTSESYGGANIVNLSGSMRLEQARSDYPSNVVHGRDMAR